MIRYYYHTDRGTHYCRVYSTWSEKELRAWGSANGIPGRSVFGQGSRALLDLSGADLTKCGLGVDRETLWADARAKTLHGRLRTLGSALWDFGRNVFKAVGLGR